MIYDAQKVISTNISSPYSHFDNKKPVLYIPMSLFLLPFP